MDGNGHEQSVQSTISLGTLNRSELLAIALLVPRVVLGWTSLQLGWQAMHLAPPPLNAAWLLALGLTLSGIALMLGLLTGPAAFVSGTLGAGVWEHGDALAASTMFGLAMVLVVAWRHAGRIGLDRWLLPSLGLAGYRSSLVTVVSRDSWRDR